MTRPFHSASSVAIKCDRAWAYRYIAKLREPDVDWSVFEAGTWACPHAPEGAHIITNARTGVRVCKLCSRIRSAALGKAVHSVGEAWYTGGTVDWGKLPAQVFLSGSHLLPHPSKCDVVATEACVGDVGDDTLESDAVRGEALDLSQWYGEDFAKRAFGGTHVPVLVVGGVRWFGKRDLFARSPGESARLGIDAEALLVDYKSSADVRRYAKTPEELREDVACSLYALDCMRHTRLVSQVCRWLYVETKEVRRAAAVDVTINRPEAEAVVCAAAERARTLDSYVRVEDAPPNTDACEEYGGCPFHNSRGGPCNARRSLGATLFSRVQRRDNSNMAGIVLTAQQLKDLHARTAARSAAEATATAPVSVETPAETPVETEPPAPPALPPAKRGRPPRVAAVTSPTAVEAPVASPVVTVDAIGAIAALVAERDAARARAAELDEQLSALQQTLTAALG